MQKDIADKMRDTWSNMYCVAVESFLQSLGVTKGNAAEYEILTVTTDCSNSTIWHKGVKVGEVRSRLDTENGLRFVVECELF